MLSVACSTVGDKKMKTLLSIVGVVAALALVCVGSYIGNYNYGNEAEKQITAEYSNMENILAQGALKVQEVAQVPGMMTDDLARVSREAMAGRYGTQGSQAVFQWIQENYPGQLSPSLYIQIQQVIEAFRDKFTNAQTKFIDVKRSYETNLGYLWKGFWLKIAGYPKIDLEKFQIISSDSAKKAFETGIDEPLKLR